MADERHLKQLREEVRSWKWSKRLSDRVQGKMLNVQKLNLVKSLIWLVIFSYVYAFVDILIYTIVIFIYGITRATGKCVIGPMKDHIF